MTQAENAHSAFAMSRDIMHYATMNNLRLYRELRGLTQSQLADIIGVNQSTVARAEAEHPTVKLSTYKSCARALNVTLADIFAQDRGQFVASLIPILERIPSEMHHEIEQILRRIESLRNAKP